MEQVVLLDESGHATGYMDKTSVHDRRTPLHLAFSCYVFDSDDRLLLTRRAPVKSTWPGVLTNTCCGHPGPGESLDSAVSRRLHEELGITVQHMELVLPRFRYRAVMDNGVVENEMCPVFRAVTADAPRPVPSEVAETEWVSWPRFTEDVLAARTAVSPWCREQVGQLVELGPEPHRWPRADHEDLPAAAR
ncbi:isopentenyl-diphosphate Delta-isomerase [Parasphingorhabdus pacifica]